MPKGIGYGPGDHRGGDPRMPKPHNMDDQRKRRGRKGISMDATMMRSADPTVRAINKAMTPRPPRNPKQKDHSPHNGYK